MNGDRDDFRRSALREFLMERRARLMPSDVGLPERKRRRTRGLNRDEVAQLAGISTLWYERFESQRNGNLSDERFDAVARALRLNGAERVYLRFLASGFEPPKPLPARSDFWALVTAGDASIAAVVDAGYQVVFANPMMRAVFGFGADERGPSANMILRVLAERDASPWGARWEDAAAQMVAHVRWMSAVIGAFPESLETLRRNPAFEALWSRHDVAIPWGVRPGSLVCGSLGALRFTRYAPRIENGYIAFVYVPADADVRAKLSEWSATRSLRIVAS